MSSLIETHSDVASWCKNQEDALNYDYKSSAYIDWICPYCHTEIKHKMIRNIVKDGLSCPKCSDKISYPQKLMMHVLSYIKDNYIEWLEIETEYSPEWCVYEYKGKHKGRYDFAIKRQGKVLAVIEMDGLFHYINNELSGQTAFESDLIDLSKNLACKENLGFYPIRINCKKSELEYIKANILDSELYHLFMVLGDVDLETDIDWENCERRSLKNIVKTVCDLYNEGLIFDQIMDKTLLSRSAVYTYLKKGSKVGLCNYPDGREEQRRKEATSNHFSKQIICLNDGKVFKNAREASEYYSLRKETVNAWAKGTKRCATLHSDGTPYNFMYVEDYKNQGARSLTPYTVTSKGKVKHKAKKQNRKDKKKVVCLNTEEHFESIGEAAKKYNTFTTSISENCKGKASYTGRHPDTNEKLVWRFEEEYSEKRESFKATDVNHFKTGRKGFEIICLNTMEVFSSAVEAAKKFGLTPSVINKVATDSLSFCGFYDNTKEPLVWKYTKDYNENETITLPLRAGRQIRYIMLENLVVFDTTKDLANYFHIGSQTKSIYKIIKEGQGRIEDKEIMLLSDYFTQHSEIKNQLTFYREHVYLPS